MAQLAERSAVNRQVLGSIPSGGVFFFFDIKIKSDNQKKKTPPLGIEPRTCRLTAERSANWAMEALPCVQIVLLKK